MTTLMQGMEMGLLALPDAASVPMTLLGLLLTSVALRRRGDRRVVSA
jgi:hypothetical protein